MFLEKYESGTRGSSNSNNSRGIQNCFIWENDSIMVYNLKMLR